MAVQAFPTSMAVRVAPAAPVLGNSVPVNATLRASAIVCVAAPPVSVTGIVVTAAGAAAAGGMTVSVYAPAGNGGKVTRPSLPVGRLSVTDAVVGTLTAPAPGACTVSVPALYATPDDTNRTCALATTDVPSAARTSTVNVLCAVAVHCMLSDSAAPFVETMVPSAVVAMGR